MTDEDRVPQTRRLDSHVAALQSRLQAGEMSDDKLRLAAVLGNPASRHVLGEPADEVFPDPRLWLRALACWGPHVITRIALTRLSDDVREVQGRFPDAGMALTRWYKSARDADARSVMRAVKSAREQAGGKSDALAQLTAVTAPVQAIVDPEWGKPFRASEILNLIGVRPGDEHLEAARGLAGLVRDRLLTWLWTAPESALKSFPGLDALPGTLLEKTAKAMTPPARLELIKVLSTGEECVIKTVDGKRARVICSDMESYDFAKLRSPTRPEGGARMPLARIVEATPA